MRDDEKKIADDEAKTIKTMYGAYFDPRVIKNAFHHKDPDMQVKSNVEAALDDMAEMNIEMRKMGVPDDEELILERDPETGEILFDEMEEEEVIWERDPTHLPSKEVLEEEEMLTFRYDRATGKVHYDIDNETPEWKEAYKAMDGTNVEQAEMLMEERMEHLDMIMDDMGLDFPEFDFYPDTPEDLQKLIAGAKKQFAEKYNNEALDKLSDDELERFYNIERKGGEYYDKAGNKMNEKLDFFEDFDGSGSNKLKIKNDKMIEENYAGETKDYDFSEEMRGMGLEGDEPTGTIFKNADGTEWSETKEQMFNPTTEEVDEVSGLFDEAMLKNIAARENTTLTDEIGNMIRLGKISPEVAAKLGENFEGLENFTNKYSGVKMSKTPDGKLTFDFGDGAILEGDMMAEGAGEGLGALADVGGAMSKLAEFAATYSTEIAIVGRGLSLASHVAGVIGLGVMAYDIGSTIYHGVEDQKKYSKAADEYIETFGSLTKMNKSLRESYNNSVDDNNKFTRMYHKYILQKNDPSQEDNGKLLRKFTYKSDFDSIADTSTFDTVEGYQTGRDKIYSSIGDYMLRNLKAQQAEKIDNAPFMFRGALKDAYRKKNNARKRIINEGLKRVDLGKENTKYSWWDDIWIPVVTAMGGDDTADMQITDGLLDKKEEREGRAKLKIIYDAARENLQRTNFLKHEWGSQRTSLTPSAKREHQLLGTNDVPLIQHYEQQVQTDPAFIADLQRRTNEVNAARRASVFRVYSKLKGESNRKFIKLGNANPMLKGIYDVARRKEWAKIDKREQSDYTRYSVSSDNILQGGVINPGMFHGMDNTGQHLPYWIDYRQKNLIRYHNQDINDILKNQQAWIKRGRKPIKIHYDDTIPPAYTGDVTEDYNPFINPEHDIKRTLRIKPKPKKPVLPPTPPAPPVKPKPPKKPDNPNEPIPDKPKPLPPHKPRRFPARRRLLGEADTYTLEPEKTNEFDKNIAFDFNIAYHLLKLSENAYLEFNPEPNKYPTQDKYGNKIAIPKSVPPIHRPGYTLHNPFNYNIIEDMGSEGFGATEQGKMYYSKSDNIISIAYRGTDFNRGFSTLKNPYRKYAGIFYSRPDMLISDIINDLDVRQTQFEDLLLHEGFLNFYLKTQDQVFKFIEDNADADTLFYTTGHSYGAIPSVILGYMLNKHYGERRAINYNFGSPRGMDKRSAEIIMTQLTTFRVADVKDPITLLPPSRIMKGYIKLSWYHTGTTLFLDGGNKNDALGSLEKFQYWWKNREQGIRIIDDLDEANDLYNAEITTTHYGKLGVLILNAFVISSKIYKKFRGIRTRWNTGEGFMLTAALQTVKDAYNFVELNKHSLETYDILLSKHRSTYDLFGVNVRTEKQMLQDMDAIKDKENNFYSRTKQEFNDKPIFTQTDNDYLKFVPHYHKDTGITMQPIPSNLRSAILGFVVLSDEQYNSPNMIKGIAVY